MWIFQLFFITLQEFCCHYGLLSVDWGEKEMNINDSRRWLQCNKRWNIERGMNTFATCISVSPTHSHNPCTLWNCLSEHRYSISNGITDCDYWVISLVTGLLPNNGGGLLDVICSTLSAPIVTAHIFITGMEPWNFFAGSFIVFITLAAPKTNNDFRNKRKQYTENIFCFTFSSLI